MSEDAEGYPIKLVRDRTSDHVRDQHIAFRSVTDDDEHRKLLRQKLVEEVGEYLLDPCITELADVLETVNALAIVDLRITPAAVARVAANRVMSRGGFTLGMVMVGRET